MGLSTVLQLALGTEFLVPCMSTGRQQLDQESSRCCWKLGICLCSRRARVVQLDVGHAPGPTFVLPIWAQVVRVVACVRAYACWAFISLFFFSEIMSALTLMLSCLLILQFGYSKENKKAKERREYVPPGQSTRIPSVLVNGTKQSKL